MLLTEHEYIQGMFNALEKNLAADETIKVMDTYPTGPVDMRSTVTKLKHQKFDALGVFSTPGQIGQFYKLLAEQKINTPTFGTNYFENFDDVKLSAGAMNGAVYVHNEVQSSFIERYESIYHNKSQIAFGAMAYEFAILVGNLFTKNDQELSADKIMEKFSQVKPQEGKATGGFQYMQTEEGDRYFRFPIVLKEVEGERYKIIGR